MCAVWSFSWNLTQHRHLWTAFIVNSIHIWACSIEDSRKMMKKQKRSFLVLKNQILKHSHVMSYRHRIGLFDCFGLLIIIGYLRMETCIIQMRKQYDLKEEEEKSSNLFLWCNCRWCKTQLYDSLHVKLWFACVCVWNKSIPDAWMKWCVCFFCW